MTLQSQAQLPFSPEPLLTGYCSAPTWIFPAAIHSHIYSIMPDGSGLTRLTNNLIYDGFDESRMNYPAGGDLPD